MAALAHLRVGTILVWAPASRNDTYVLAMIVLAALALIGFARPCGCPRAPAPRDAAVGLTTPPRGTMSEEASR